MQLRTLTKTITLVGALAALALAAACGNNDDPGGSGGISTGSGTFAVYSSPSSLEHPPLNTILVAGAGSVEVAADIAHLSLGVESIGRSIAEARGEAASALDAILGELRQHDVANDDIKTAFFNIQPEYDYRLEGRPRLAGFRVSNLLNVTVRNLETVGEIIDAAVQAGGDATRVNDIRFDAESRESAQREAWQLAVRNATKQADLLAAEAGIARGAPVFISSDSPSYSTPVARGLEAYADSSASTPILPGSLTVNARVTVAFAIDQ